MSTSDKYQADKRLANKRQAEAENKNWLSEPLRIQPIVYDISKKL
jgi:hypothetical protein